MAEPGSIVGERGGFSILPKPRVQRADEHRQRLRKIIADVIAVADGMNAASAPVMRKIDERVESDAFRVMVPYLV